MGVVGMAKEHLGVALALKVPVFFIVTKTDICPEHVLKQTLAVRGRRAGLRLGGGEWAAGARSPARWVAHMACGAFPGTGVRGTPPLAT